MEAPFGFNHTTLSCFVRAKKLFLFYETVFSCLHQLVILVTCHETDKAEVGRVGCVCVSKVFLSRITWIHAGVAYQLPSRPHAVIVMCSVSLNY